ncbi:MAG: hypothetical protein M1839_005890 [Geoglossum umbratile]|nr:MAG: hypothetical protein M1839_005890 [Geoglossum umbratile]
MRAFSLALDEGQEVTEKLAGYEKELKKLNATQDELSTSREVCEENIKAIQIESVEWRNLKFESIIKETGDTPDVATSEEGKRKQRDPLGRAKSKKPRQESDSGFGGDPPLTRGLQCGMESKDFAMFTRDLAEQRHQESSDLNRQMDIVRESPGEN